MSDDAPTIAVPLSAEDLHTLIYALEMAPDCHDIGLGVHLTQYLVNVQPAPADPLTDDISAKRREIEP